MSNPDIHRALFHATPPRANPASLRHGVAWWGDFVGVDSCWCCRQRTKVRKGYNGGARMSARFCGPCTAAGHVGCEREESTR